MAMKEGLTDNQQQRIVKNYELLISDLDLNEVIDVFISKGYFDTSVEEEIKAEAQPPTPKNKNKVFIAKFLKLSPSAYDVFVDRLSEKGFHHIVDALDKTQVETRQRPQGRDIIKELKDACLYDTKLDDRRALKFNLTVAKDMEILGNMMGFSQAEIDHIKMEATYSAATQMHKLFTKWRHRYGNKATLGLLAETLRDAEAAGAYVDWDKYDAGVASVKEMISVK